MFLMAKVERHTAETANLLLIRDRLTPNRMPLSIDKGGGAQNGHLAEKFPDDMPCFERLEVMAPDADRPQIGRMIEYEVVAVLFLSRGRDVDPTSTEPLLTFISTPAAT